VASTEETFQQLVAALDCPMFIATLPRRERIEPGHEA